ncbi:hypothetical protein [Nostoc sp. KVJ3]|uniref:hypothetical protein n=1 Tax=Nostoc sp. KVJ3 TaxID=457945 RepID=UPI0022387416|nr:hypothetical protein [Nostoc sp. KVJ3]
MKSSFRLNDNALRYFLFFGLVGSLLIHSFIKYGLLNQTIGLIMPKASAQVPVINSPNGLTPDWSRFKFSDMIISLSGSVTYPGTRGTETETRTWAAGQSISEFMELGDFETPQLAIENLNLSTIASVQGINLSGLTLDDFQLTRWQTLPSLTKAIPGLGNRNVTSVKPVSDFLRRFGITGAQ